MYELELAFVAMKTPSFYELPPQAQAQLIQTFPIFYICIFMLPLYYMVTKLAEEKESKIRESMKMMGLSDTSYYKLHRTHHFLHYSAYFADRCFLDVRLPSRFCDVVCLLSQHFWDIFHFDLPYS